MLRFILAFFLALIVGEAVAQSPRVVPDSRTAIDFSYAPIVKKVTPAVVNVYASRIERRPANPLFNDPFFRQFFGEGQSSDRVAQSLGSGVIVDSSGLIVTNNHVIKGMTNVKVALSDRREFAAKIVLRDPRTDLAVLRIEGGSNFPVLPIGNSDSIEVGDLVLAVGDPFGVGQTVTQGIVSALARTRIGASDYGFFIQTDAAINPGNSGGALVNMQAQLIGLNSEIYSRSGGSMGIGFAIPSNMVKIVVAAAKAGDHEVTRPWIGARFQSVTRSIADSLGLATPQGALVADIDPQGPAARAGVKRGDVILDVDHEPVEDPRGLDYRIATKPLGGAAVLTIYRAGRRLELTMQLVGAPEIPPRDPVTITGRNPLAGATFWNVSPAVKDQLAIEGVDKGVVVARVAPQSNAANVGLRRGDVILAVNNSRIADTDALRRVAAARENYWKLSVARGGRILTSIVGGR